MNFNKNLFKSNSKTGTGGVGSSLLSKLKTKTKTNMKSGDDSGKNTPRNDPSPVKKLHKKKR